MCFKVVSVCLVTDDAPRPFWVPPPTRAAHRPPLDPSRNSSGVPSTWRRSRPSWPTSGTESTGGPASATSTSSRTTTTRGGSSRGARLMTRSASRAWTASTWKSSRGPGTSRSFTTGRSSRRSTTRLSTSSSLSTGRQVNAPNENCRVCQISSVARIGCSRTRRCLFSCFDPGLDQQFRSQGSWWHLLVDLRSIGAVIISNYGYCLSR